MGDEKIQDKMERLLREALNPSNLAIQDQSHLHEGHTGKGKGGHFDLQITSTRFEGLSPLECQRLVYSVLSGMVGEEIHALSMKCRVPAVTANSPL